MSALKHHLDLGNGQKAGNLSDLRKCNNKSTFLDLFHTGKLLKWLDAYDYDEYEDVLDIPENASDDIVLEKLSDILQLSFETNAKEEKLRKWTTDSNILTNSDITAFDDGELADLLRNGNTIIYLCAKEDNVFNIRLKYKNVKYIGILGTPKIETRAKSQAELEQNGIKVENLSFPWTDNIKPQLLSKEYKPLNDKNTSSDKNMSKLNNYFVKSFGKEPGWNIYNKENGELSRDVPDEYDKETFLKRLIIDEKNEKIVHIASISDFSLGFALTDKSIHVMGDLIFYKTKDEYEKFGRKCLNNKDTKKIFNYSDIDKVEYSASVLTVPEYFSIISKDGYEWLLIADELGSIFQLSCLDDEKCGDKLAKFLNRAKDL